MSSINDLIKKNEPKLKNVAQRLFDKGEDVTYMLEDGTYIKKYQDGKREIFKFVDGHKQLIKIYYE